MTRTTTPAPQTRPATKALRIAGVVFFLAFLWHNADHARRGLTTTPEGVVWGGTIVVALVGVILTLIAVDHALAPFFAAAGGFTIALGVSASHLLPDWGPVSESLSEANVDAFTWAAVLAEIAGAAWLGWTGLKIARAQDFQLAAPTPA